MPRTTQSQSRQTLIEASPEKLAVYLELKRRVAARTVWRWGWPTLARPDQLPPDGDWFVWLIMAGRGWGKTRTGAEWLADQAMTQPDTAWAVVSRTTQDGREVALEGRSGLLRALGLAIDSREYNRTTGEIRLSNGTVIYSYSAERPDRIRGPNLNGAWCDELGAWNRKLGTVAWHEGLIPALRMGRPRVAVTTTPRLVPLVRELATRDDGSVVITRGTTFDNAANLSPEALAELERRYAGTRIGRQELYGELLEDVEGALWRREWLEDRVTEIPPLDRIAVAIDPAVTAGEDSDETGLIVAGRGTDGHAYVLEDLSCRVSPDQWIKRALDAYQRLHANLIVGEVNNGGDVIRSLLRTQDDRAVFKAVRAAHSKQARAEPIAALYEQGRVHHVGVFPELEDQLTSWVPGESGASPDRLDALVWGLSELMVGPGGPARVTVPQGVRRGGARGW